MTSLGLALATWLKRTGLAVAISVGAFVLASIGWIIAVVAVVRPLLDWWSKHVTYIENGTILTIEQATLALSPLGGQVDPVRSPAQLLEPRPLRRLWKLLLLDAAFVSLVAAVLLGLTLADLQPVPGKDERVSGSCAASGESRFAPIGPSSTGPLGRAMKSKRTSPLHASAQASADGRFGLEPISHLC